MFKQIYNTLYIVLFFLFSAFIYELVYVISPKNPSNEKISNTSVNNIKLKNQILSNNSRNYTQQLDDVNATIQFKTLYTQKKNQNVQTNFMNCNLFYLDMGTNIGVQIRKLYQPEYYPDSPILPIFDKYFGIGPVRNTNSRLCAIGFEINPSHTQRLKTLESNYNRCGFKTKIFTETAVATYDGNISFWTDNDFFHEEWGASTVYQWHGSGPTNQVNAINIANFISRHILPHAQTIVVKLDIEGSEKNVLPHLFEHGVLCNIDFMFLETHQGFMDSTDAQNFEEFFQQLDSKLEIQQCKVQISHLDDETYLRDEQNKLDSCGVK